MDLFRAIAIGGMVLVNNNGGEGAYAQLRHSRWHGVTFADFVFPFFLWIAGLSALLACHRRLSRGVPRGEVFAHAAQRCLILILLGLFLAGFPRFDLAHLRFMGILQRIGICVLVTTALDLYTSRAVRLGVLLACLTGYTVLLHPGGYERESNLSNRVDAVVLGAHNARDTVTWDTEGVLSTIPALATCLLGALVGRRLLERQQGELWLMVQGAVLLVMGVVASHWQPLNKSIWTPSYVLVTGGASALVFGVLYRLVDVQGWRGKGLRPAEILGRHALAVYIFHDFFATGLRRVTAGGVSLDDRLRAFWGANAPSANAKLGYACTHLLASLVLAFVLSWYSSRRRPISPPVREIA